VVKSISSVVPANRAEANGWEGGECVSTALEIGVA
jgi:hypothetical protein